MIRRVSVFTAGLLFFFTVPAWSQEAPQGPAGLQTATSEFVNVKWRQVSEGVWQAKDAEGATLSYASGQAGLKWALSELKTELVEMSAAVAKKPSNERLADLEALLGTIDQINSDIKGNASGETIDIEKTTAPSCIYSYDVYAVAAPAVQGSTATANSSWHIKKFGGCLGTVYGRSTATVTKNGVTLNEYDSCSQTNYGAYCSTYVHIFGDYDDYWEPDSTCRSTAYAYVYSSAAGVFYSNWSESCRCGYFGPGCGGPLPTLE